MESQNDSWSVVDFVFWLPLFIYTFVLMLLGFIAIPDDDFPHEEEDDNDL